MCSFYEINETIILMYKAKKKCSLNDIVFSNYNLSYEDTFYIVTTVLYCLSLSVCIPTSNYGCFTGEVIVMITTFINIYRSNV